MRGDPLAFYKDLDSARRQPDLDLAAGEAVGDASLSRWCCVKFLHHCSSLSVNPRTPSREVLASLRGRRAGRHMMGSEGEAEQSEKRPAEAEEGVRYFV